MLQSHAAQDMRSRGDIPGLLPLQLLFLLLGSPRGPLLLRRLGQAGVAGGDFKARNAFSGGSALCMRKPHSRVEATSFVKPPNMEQFSTRTKKLR